MKGLTVKTLLSKFKVDFNEECDFAEDCDCECPHEYWEKNGSYLEKPVVIKDVDGQCYNFDVYEGYRQLELQIKEKVLI